MATPPDFIAIARDIAQESCLRFPITEDKHISQREGFFSAAKVVKEMCDIFGDLEEGSTKLILFCALVVELAACCFKLAVARNPDTDMFGKYVLAATRSMQSLMIFLSIYYQIEDIKDNLSTTAGDSEPEVEEIETLKSDLIDALAHVRLSHPAEISISTH